MLTRKLTRWQRLSIVISVLWIIGAGVWQRHSDLDSADRFASSIFNTCEDSAALLRDSNKDKACIAELQKNYFIGLEGSWGNVAIMAFLPLLLGWPLFLSALGVVRWVMRGSVSKSPKPDAMPVSHG